MPAVGRLEPCYPDHRPIEQLAPTVNVHFCHFVQPWVSWLSPLVEEQRGDLNTHKNLIVAGRGSRRPPRGSCGNSLGRTGELGAPPGTFTNNGIFALSRLRALTL